MRKGVGGALLQTTGVIRFLYTRKSETLKRNFHVRFDHCSRAPYAIRVGWGVLDVAAAAGARSIVVEGPVLGAAAGRADWAASLEDAGGAVHGQWALHACSIRSQVEQRETVAVVFTECVDRHCGLPIAALEAAGAHQGGVAGTSRGAERRGEGKVELSCLKG